MNINQTFGLTYVIRRFNEGEPPPRPAVQPSGSAANANATSEREYYESRRFSRRVV